MEIDAIWRAACAEQCPDPEGEAGRLLAALGELLDVAQVEYAKTDVGAVFLFDLGPLGFKGLDFNVVMVTHPPHTEQERCSQAEMLLDYRGVVKSDGHCFQVFLSDTAPSEEAAIATTTVVQLCGADIKRLFESKVPRGVLFDLIRRQIPLQRLCPYNSTHAAAGAMFFGRGGEVADLTKDLDTNFVVQGARRIGKTSLLTQAVNKLRMQPQNRDRVHFFHCLTWGAVQDCFRRLSHAIDTKRELRITYGPRDFVHHYNPRNILYLLESQSRSGRRPLLMFFDESDRMIETDAANGWPFTKVLFEAAEQRWIRVVFAGFRSMVLLTHGPTCRRADLPLAPDSPFFGALKGLELAALSRLDCIDLIVQPFKRLEIWLRPQEVIAERIWRATVGHPFFVQFYGELLFRMAAQRTPTVIGVEDIDEIEKGFQLHDFLLTHFLENTMHQGRSVDTERCCMVLLAHEKENTQWGQADFKEALDREKRPVSTDEINRSLRNLHLANMLSFRDGRYCITLPLMQRSLRKNYPILSALLKSDVGGAPS